MKNLNKIITSIFYTCLCMGASAQDRSNFYTQLLNPYLSNPALTGSYDAIHAAFNAKTLVGGIASSPRTINFSLHSTLGKSSDGIGVKAISQWSGAFQTVNLEGSYSKLVRLANNHNLNLGLSLGFMQTNLNTDFLSSQVNFNDPTLTNPTLNDLLVTGGAGFVYRFKKQLEIYGSSPMMLTGSQNLNGFFIAGANYTFIVDENAAYKIKPIVNYYNFVAAPKLVDVIVSGSWNETVSLNLGYRTHGSAIIGLGFNFKNVLVNYNYYHHTGNLNKLAPASNEVSIAFNFRKPERRIPSKEIVNDQIIQDQIEKINLKINALLNLEQNSPGLINIKNEMAKLNKDLEKILAKYKIENIDQLKRIKELQTNLELIIAKFNDK
ncbi:MAG: PorP/SprF family type IX secretion system membrane protein [Bacteroidota bacterium]|nr:PorP/SprF family type IX secretion system membrane protein [Bacteroidota bacterium]